MATIKISDLHSVELEHQFTALTGDELANIQGGGGKRRQPKPKGKKRAKIKTVGKYANIAANVAWISSEVASFLGFG